eukprot:gene7463-15275_t
MSGRELQYLCVGLNSFGQLGIGDKRREPDSFFKPIAFGKVNENDSIITGADTADIQCGSIFTIRLAKDEKQIQWTGCFNGVVSPLLTDFHSISLPLKFTQIVCGRKHILGLLEKNIVVSWGIGFFGQLGHGDDSSWDSPKVLEFFEPKRFGDKVIKLSCGGSHSGAITERGKVFMWGLNRNGQCGIVSKSDSILDPRPIDFSEVTTTSNSSTSSSSSAVGSIRPVSLICGRNHSAMLSSEGKVYTWGAAGFGRLGLNDARKKQTTPCEVITLSTVRVKSLAIGDFHSLALTTDNSVYSWGYNAEGQCGHGHVFHLRTPQRIIALEDIEVNKLICGSTWSVALTTSGEMYSWGYGDGGWLVLKPPPAHTMPFIDPDTDMEACNPDIFSTFHTQSFESKHNVLGPKRVSILKNYFIHDIRCGAGKINNNNNDKNMIEKRSSSQLLYKIELNDEKDDDNDNNDEKSNGSDTSMDSDDDDIQDLKNNKGNDDHTLNRNKRNPPSLHQIFSWCRHKKISYLSYALMQKQFDINMTDENGNTALIIACQNGHMQIVQLLVEYGADVRTSNYKGNTPLHYCFAFSFQDLGEFLIQHGADEFAVNEEGLTCYEGLSKSFLDAL